VVKRSATLIELIFTIIILGITIKTIPIVLSQIAKNDESSIKQEAISAGATKISNILTYEWDEKNSVETDIKHILDVTNGDIELNRIDNSTCRVGHFKGSNRRKFFPIKLFASPIGIDDANESIFPDDIDDFNAKVDTLLLNSVSNQKSFILTTTIAYVNDKADYNQNTLFFEFNTTAISPSTNLKMIEVTIKESQNNQTIATFRSYAANIGSFKLLHRTFY
jgi:hypothetical protein